MLIDSGKAVQKVLGIDSLEKFKGRWTALFEEGILIYDLTNIRHTIYESSVTTSQVHFGANGTPTRSIEIVDENHFRYSANNSPLSDVWMNSDGTVSFGKKTIMYENQATKVQISGTS
mgnify:CR=1 FL=1